MCYSHFTTVKMMQSGVSCGLFTVVKLHHHQRSLHEQSDFLIIRMQVYTKNTNQIQSQNYLFF